MVHQKTAKLFSHLTFVINTIANTKGKVKIIVKLMSVKNNQSV